MNNIDNAYAAGAMEGDGSFYITRTNYKGCTRFVAGAGIGKSSKELAGFFVSSFSGNLYTRKEQHKWSVSCTPRVVPFLESVIPYLVMKKERAIFLLDWLKNGMPEKENAYNQMKILNAKVDKELTPLNPNETVDDDPLKWAYIAGLMDTDGSFLINKRHGHNGMKSPSYMTRVSYGEKDVRTPSFIQKTFALGCINLKDNNKCVNGRFVWELVVKEEIIDFINRVLPYLKVKKPNAEILLNFCKNYNPMKKGHRFGIPKEELEFREKCYQDIKKHQRRGTCDLYKSSLMDLNAPPDSAEGNKAEAAQAGTVNVVSERTSKDDAVL